MSNSRFYDEIAPTYDAKRYGKDYYRRVAELELAYLEPFLPQGRYLELGPGTGRVTRLLLEHADALHAVDVSAGMIEQLRSKFAATGKLRTQLLDVSQLATVEGYGSFDCAVSLRVVPHLPDLDGALRLLSGAVHDGGRVIFDLWSSWGYDAVAKAIGLKKRAVYTHYVSVAEMRRAIARAGLRVISSRPFGYPPFKVLLALERSAPPVIRSFAHRRIWVCTPERGQAAPAA